MAGFEKAIDLVLRNEGGYVNDPADAGGETNFGISKRAHPDVDVRHLTRSQAEAIYRREYWAKHPQLQDLENQDVATKVFDLMVNMGPKRAVTILQASINDAGGACLVAEDGRLGPTTVARANEVDPALLLAKIRDNAARFYCHIVKAKPSQSKFLRTWLLRAYDRPYSKREPTPACPAD